MTHKTWKSMLGPLVITAVSVCCFTACTGHDEEEQVAPDSANHNEANEANEANGDAPNATATADSAEASSEPSEAAASEVASSEADSSTVAAEPGASEGQATEAAAAAGAVPASSDMVASSEPAAAPAAPAAPAPAHAAASAAPGPSAAAAPAPSAGATRVVRYIQADQTSLYSAASETAPVAARLEQGDILVVLEEQGWGRVNDQLFVKLDAVSARAVPRTFSKPEWQAPAH